MPSGRQRGLPWTRTAAGLAAAVAALEALGQDGLERLAQHLYGLAERVAEALRAAGGPGAWRALDAPSGLQRGA